MMPVSDAAKSAIRDAIAQALSPVEVTAFDIAPDEDKDGEEILRVVVVLDNDKPKVDGRKLLSASVMVQKALDKMQDRRFALIDYVSASDTDNAVE